MTEHDDHIECATGNETVSGTPMEWDFLLCALVDVVNRTDLSISVTLSIGGGLVCGELIGGRAYFEGVAESLGAAKGNAASGVIETLQRALRKFVELYPDPANKPEQEDQHPTPSFVHLRNAYFFTAHGVRLPTGAGVWWRGRISAVDGFFIGTLAVD